MDAAHETAGAGTETRFLTVQCGYPSWHACTVVVEASTVEQACERPIEEASACRMAFARRLRTDLCQCEAMRLAAHHP